MVNKGILGEEGEQIRRLRLTNTHYYQQQDIV